MPARAEAELSAVAAAELVAHAEREPGQRDDHELRDPHARLDREGLLAVGVDQRHADLAAIAAVDETRRADDADAVVAREPRTRQDEAAGPLRQLDRDAAAERGACARRELRRL